MTDLSIIIPVFNRQQMGERALRSALAQNAADAEIILVDDCSEPAFELPAALAAPNIRIIRHPANRGAAAARNTGIEGAHGDWLAFLDSDDTWLPGTLAPRMAMAKGAHAADPGMLTAYAAGFVLEDKHTGRHQERIPRASNNPLDFASGCWFSPGSTLIAHRNVFQAVGPYDIGLSRLEDLDWFLRLALAGGRLERWPHTAALIELGGKPSLKALEQAAQHLMAKYATPDSPARLGSAYINRLKAYIDVERASIHAAQRRWDLVSFYMARSLFRAPRVTLHLERFWD
jgi:glycosyltransferase involved in cell wall biosynthesis